MSCFTVLLAVESEEENPEKAKRFALTVALASGLKANVVSVQDTTGITCADVAEVFAEDAARAEYPENRHALKARVEMLRMFGDMQIPAKMWEKWDWGRMEKAVRERKSRTQPSVVSRTVVEAGLEATGAADHEER